ncbi:MAG: hypothetical protein AB7O26_00800 [Planctomycetaceae bacterium]
MNWQKVAGGLAAVAVLLFGIVWMMPGDGAAQSESIVTYVCSETGAVIATTAQQEPALNPATGRRTLLRGVYCPQCEKWYRAPSPEHSGGNPRPLVCGVHQVPMTYEGPSP